MASADEVIQRHGPGREIHLTAAEQDPDYRQHLINRKVAQSSFYVKTRVVKSIPKQKEAKPPGKVKSFLNNFKNPAVQEMERRNADRIEGKTYHTNEKGQIIETTKIRIAQLDPSACYARGMRSGDWGDYGGGGGGGE